MKAIKTTTRHSAPAKNVVLTMEPEQLVAWLRLASEDGAGRVLSEYHAGKLGQPRVWFSQQEAAAYIGIHEVSLCNFCVAGTGPVNSRIGRLRRFHRSDLDQWIREGGSYVHAPRPKKPIPN